MFGRLPTTPMTVNHGPSESALPLLMRRPMASWPGQAYWASVSLMIATSGAPARSAAVKSRVISARSIAESNQTGRATRPVLA